MKIIFPILFFLFLFFLPGCVRIDCQTEKDCPLTDKQYTQIAKNTLEAQAFLQKYPDANAFVDRSGALAVEFRVESTKEYSPMQNNPVPPYLRLRVFINPKTSQPITSFIECRPNSKDYQQIEQNIVDYIKTENCLK